MARPMIIVQRRLESVGQGRERPAVPTVGTLSLAQAKPAPTTPAPAAAAPSPESRPVNPSPQPKQGGPAPIERLAVMYPAIFDFHAPRPLALGTYHHVAAALPDLSHGAVSRLLQRWTKRLNYLAAIAAPGSRRFNLDGSDAGEVSDEHRAHAAERLAEKSAVTLEPDNLPAWAALSRSTYIAGRREMPRVAATARKLKVTTVLDTAAFATMQLSDSAMPRSELTVNVNGRQFRADIATKSLRRVLASIAEHGADGVVVLIQGVLGTGDTISEAGLTAQPKAPAKATAA